MVLTTTRRISSFLILQQSLISKAWSPLIVKAYVTHTVTLLLVRRAEAAPFAYYLIGARLTIIGNSRHMSIRTFNTQHHFYSLSLFAQPQASLCHFSSFPRSANGEQRPAFKLPSYSFHLPSQYAFYDPSAALSEFGMLHFLHILASSRLPLTSPQLRCLALPIRPATHFVPILL